MFAIFWEFIYSFAYFWTYFDKFGLPFGKVFCCRWQNIEKQSSHLVTLLPSLHYSSSYYFLSLCSKLSLSLSSSNLSLVPYNNWKYDLFIWNSILNYFFQAQNTSLKSTTIAQYIHLLPPSLVQIPSTPFALIPFIVKLCVIVSRKGRK